MTFDQICGVLLSLLTSANQWIVEWKPSVRAFLYDWQVLLAGLLAFIGAAWTVKQVRAQIDQVNTLEEKRRSREEDAAKAVLPLALSELCQYASDCLQLLVRHVPPDAGILAVPADVTIPRVPSNVIGTLQACARYADGAVVEKIAGLLSKLQVQHARLEGWASRDTGRVVVPTENAQRVLDAADVHAKASALFAYARNLEALRRGSMPDELRSSLRANGIWDEMYPTVYEMIARIEANRV